MPDKHEVGGSSPLGPTRNSSKKNFTYYLFTLHFSLRKRESESEETEITTNHYYGGVAQLGEHLPCKQGVMGSNPIISTMRYGTSQKRTLKLESKGFEQRR